MFRRLFTDLSMMVWQIFHMLTLKSAELDKITEEYDY